MRKQLFLIFYKSFFGGLTLFAVLTQYLNDSQKPGFSLINFFSYFTIESNLIVAVVLIISALAILRKNTSNKLDIARGGSVLYMITTAVVYYILLYNLPDQNRIVWVNTILHLIVPIVALFDWVFDPPKQLISFRKALLWLMFPLIYLSYSFLRGLLSGWYPYQFLNPSGPAGITGVLTYLVIISIGVIVEIFVISKIGNLAQKLRKNI